MAKTIWACIQVALAAIGSVLGWFIGGADGFLYALIAFAVVDYITGVMRGIVKKKLSSRVGARGIAKKISIFLIVGVAHLADVYLLGNNGDALRTATIFFYLSNEGISFFENVAAIGLPVPEKLKDVLAQLRDREEK